MNKEINLKGKILIIGFSIAVVFSITKRLTRIKTTESSLNQQRLSTVGKISDFGRGGRSFSPSKYSYIVNNKKYIKTFLTHPFCDEYSSAEQNHIKAIDFTVLYYPPDPNISLFLSNRKDYKEYNVSFPDSLDKFFKKYYECMK